MKKILLLSALVLVMSPGCRARKPDKESFAESFVQVSEKNPYYFQLSNGECYIAIGCNIATIGGNDELTEEYIRSLAENGANFGRVWLNTPALEVETTYGEVNTEHLDRIARLLDLASQYGLKIKLCIESFRFIEPGEGKWDTKNSYHTANGGPFSDMWEYLTTEKGRDDYLRRLQILRDRFGDHPAVFGWELWNEMNAVNYREYTPEQNYPVLVEWNEYMLAKVKEMFPRNLVMQSLGSLDRQGSFGIYKAINSLPGNEVSQVHRYLDLGADLPVCHAPMDSLCSDAMQVLWSYGLAKPMLLAESGGVKPKHTGPHEFYEVDLDGALLHDVLFTPFFCGSAGSGHIWHWEPYIMKRDLWYHFARFAAAVKGIDPLVENFVPRRHDTDELKVYALEGERTVLAWCRDKANDWQSEFVDKKAPRVLSGQTVDLGPALGGGKVAKVEVYDPWTDKWRKAEREGKVTLPDFKRSAVIRITLK